jgi:hypothetical protein
MIDDDDAIGKLGSAALSCFLVKSTLVRERERREVKKEK